MTEAHDQTTGEFEQMLEHFEGEITEGDMAESLSAEERMARMLTDEELEPGVRRATVTRITFEESWSDRRDYNVAKLFYSLGGAEWVVEFDPRSETERNLLKTLLRREGIDPYSAASIVGRKIPAIVSGDTARLVLDESMSYADLTEAWETPWLYYNGALNEFGIRGLYAGGSVLAAGVLASLCWLFWLSGSAAAILVIAATCAFVMTILAPMLGIGGPSPTIIPGRPVSR